VEEGRRVDRFDQRRRAERHVAECIVETHTRGIGVGRAELLPAESAVHHVQLTDRAVREQIDAASKAQAVV
jgi:hypothetical protein